MDINCARELARYERERNKRNNYTHHDTIYISNQNSSNVERRLNRLENHVDEIIKMCNKSNITNSIVSIANTNTTVNSQMNITLTDEQFKEFCKIMQSK